ncbi:MAG: leucine-rich repeat protein [Ruminococcus sp.]
MNFIKKSLSIILSSAVALFTLPSTHSNSFADYVVVENYDDFLFKICSDHAELYGCYASVGTDVTIPSEVAERPVTIIRNNVFRYNTDVESVIIPSTVTQIDFGAFKDCTKLSEISFPDTLVKVGSDAVEDTLWFKNQPDGLIKTGKVAYTYKGDKSSVISIALSQDTTGIAQNAFFGCTSLSTVSLPDSVQYIGDSAFRGCKKIEEITIPPKVTGICFDSFAGCQSLVSLTIPETVTYIGAGAFQSCTSLENFSLPKNLNYLGNNSFNDTKWYNSQPDGCLYINDILYEYKGTAPDNTVIEVKEGTRWIARAAFSDQNISAVFFPDGVEILDSYSFDNCPMLKKIVLPESTTLINYDTFRGCNSLETITIPNPECIIRESDLGPTIPQNTAICALAGSEAHQFAINHDMTFINLNPDILMLGDLNGDAKITVVDASTVLQAYAEIQTSSDGSSELTSASFTAADSNGDNKITPSDASNILRYYSYVQTITDKKSMISFKNFMSA